jgi:hypothetical protein
MPYYNPFIKAPRFVCVDYFTFLSISLIKAPS